MKKKLIYLTSILAGIILFFSCSQQQYKVGILYAGNSFQADCDEMTKILRENNVQVISANAEMDMSKQIVQAKDLIEKEVDAMLIIPVNTTTSAEIVRECKNAGIKTISYERFIANSDLDYYVAFDNIFVGEILAENALKLKPKGQYAIFNGDKSDRNAQWVYEGFMNKLAPHIQSGDIEIVYKTFIENWSQENAEYEFGQYLGASAPMPDVLLSAHNRMSNGMISCIDHFKLSKYPVITGQGLDSPEYRNAWNEHQQISLFKSYKVESKAAADLLMQILEGRKIKIDRYINNGFKDVPAIVIKEVSLETH